MDAWVNGLAFPLLMAAISAAIAVIVARYQAIRTTRQQIEVRQRDLSIEVTKLLLDGGTAKAAARRFAVGVAKVMVAENGSEKGWTLFIPINSRVTVGRDSSNDIALSGPGVSRFHCGLVSDGEHVVIEDYCSTNGTKVNGIELNLGATKALSSGDEIHLPGYTILFKSVYRSSMFFR
jgi:cell division protein FtsL